MSPLEAARVRASFPQVNCYREIDGNARRTGGNRKPRTGKRSRSLNGARPGRGTHFRVLWAYICMEPPDTQPDTQGSETPQLEA